MTERKRLLCGTNCICKYIIKINASVLSVVLLELSGKEPNRMNIVS
jgi:hypothetical protein